MPGSHNAEIGKFDGLTRVCVAGYAADIQHIGNLAHIAPAFATAQKQRAAEAERGGRRDPAFIHHADGQHGQVRDIGR